MAIFKYSIKYSTGEADGTIDAGDSGEAESLLRKQYSHDDEKSYFADKDDKPITHKIISIDLKQVA